MVDMLIYIFILILQLSIFIATLYRIKLEKKQIDVVIKTVKAQQLISTLHRDMNHYQKEIMEDPKGFLEFLKELIEDANKT